LDEIKIELDKKEKQLHGLNKNSKILKNQFDTEGDKITKSFKKEDHCKIQSTHSNVIDTFEKAKNYIENVEVEIKNIPTFDFDDIDFKNNNKEAFIHNNDVMLRERIICSLITISAMIIFLIILVLLINFIY
jgi:hypothetical protein